MALRILSRLGDSDSRPVQASVVGEPQSEAVAVEKHRPGVLRVQNGRHRLPEGNSRSSGRVQRLPIWPDYFDT